MDKKKSGFMQSLTDVPMALKGFPKNLFKKPPKNKKELELYLREKSAYMWVGLALTIVGFVLGMDGIGMLVSLAGLMFIVFMFYQKNNVKNGGMADHIAELTCPACQEMVTYDKNVRHKVMDVTWSANASKQPMSYKAEEKDTCNMRIIAEGKEMTQVEITCKCQKCGTEHSFQKTFKTGYCGKGQRDVMRHQADKLVAQFSNEINEVSRDVFEKGGSGENNYGISVEHYDIAKCVADYFVVDDDILRETMNLRDTTSN